MKQDSFLGNIFANTPHIVKNLIIINVLMFLATLAFKGFIVSNFALFYPTSPYFHPHQLLTHMFMHGGLMHLFFNMYALWIFGKELERVWGGQRFLFYYLATGFGAIALHLLTLWFQVSNAESNIPPEVLENLKYAFKNNLPPEYPQVYINQVTEWADLLRTPTLGASGAVFGVLLAFGMMYPDVRLQLLFPPVILKAKWFVIIYGALELFLGISNNGGGIAHFAHVGGMLFGYIIIKYWQNKGTFYGGR